MSISGAAQTITVAIVGDVKNFESSLTTTQKRISAFGAAATVALVAFGVSAAKSFETAQASQEKLQFALSKGPKLIQANSDTLAAYNKVLEQKVAIDDNAIAGAEALLVKYSKSTAQLEQLIQLTIDYSRYTGKDLTTSAILVGKATDGQTSALRTLGITYVKTGNVAKDAYNIQVLLNNTVADYAEKYAQTAAGKSDALAVAYDNLKQSIGEGVLPIQTKWNEVLTAGINKLDSLPQGAKQAAFGVGLVASSAMAVIPQLIAMRANMIQANITMASMKKSALGAATSFKTWAGAVAAGIVIVGQATGSSDAAAQTMALGDAIRRLGDPTVAEYAGNALASFSDVIWQHSTALDDARRATTAEDTALAQMVGKGHAVEAARQFDALAAAHPEVPMDELLKLFPSYSKAAPEAGTATEHLAAAQQDAAIKTKDLRDEINKVIDAFTVLKQGFIDRKQAVSDYAAAIDAARQSLKDHGHSLDLDTAAGRANHDALVGIATAGNSVIQSLVKQHAPIDVVRAKYQGMRQDLIDQAQAYGDTKAQAKTFADQILKTPKSWVTQLKVVTDDQALIDWKKQLASIFSYITTTFSVTSQGFGGSAGGGKGHHSAGGAIFGPGTGTSDSIPAMLSNGEFVINAKSAARIGRGNLEAINRFAAGGSVGPAVGQNWTPPQYDKILQRLDDLVKSAHDQLRQIIGQRQDFAHGISTGLTSGLSLGNTLQQGRDNTPQSIAKNFQQQANRIRKFIREMTQLQKKGLSRTLTKELLDMGSEQGEPIARILLEDPQVLNNLNRTYNHLDTAADRFGNRAGQRWYQNREQNARQDYRGAKHDRNQFAREGQHIINVTVQGSVMTENQLVKTLGPKIRAELHRIERQNR